MYAWSSTACLSCLLITSALQVWVLLFGVGTRDTEGIYSLRAMSRETGVPQDTIIAFEDAEDAERCGAHLPACNVPAIFAGLGGAWSA